jgi:GH15 family glucan-1,4-alpha-glucosidase
VAVPIEDYALIGDCETAALVGHDGSIDWLCLPRFDSDSCFAAILGSSENGRWMIAPQASAKVSRKYRANTLILETTFETNEGVVRLIDLMPLKGMTSEVRTSSVVRIVVGISGRVQLKSELIMRFDYGLTVPWVSRISEDTTKAVAGPQTLFLRSPVRHSGQDLRTVGEFTIEAGDRMPFVLTHAPSHLPAPELPDAFEALQDTEQFWHEWSAIYKSAGRWSEAVIRSLITLKALTFAPTGGIVAAPTTSLPECVGGERNWDYRYCWIRDATLTLLALTGAGYLEEASAWRDWLVRAVAGSPAQMQIMYGVAGERRLWEWEVLWLDGYEGSKPVRIGNAAHSQLQLDVFGEMMDALYQARRGGLPESDRAWAVELAVLEYLASAWRKPDQGIWEVRSGPQHFTYSKMMAWVAFDRAIKTVKEFGLKGPVDEWQKLQKEIHEDICSKGYSSSLECFVQAYGTEELDASLLLMPAVGFLPPDDPRVQNTVKAIEKRLVVNGLVRRYDTHSAEDGLAPGEGVFLACSFWLADAYYLLGRLEEAEKLFERLLNLRNDVGLLSEEYDPQRNRLTGNFPQAFSHVSLINTAHNLSHFEKPAETRAR